MPREVGLDDGFVAHLRVAGGFAHARHAAEPLAEDAGGAFLRPAAHGLPGRREARTLPKAFQDVVVGNGVVVLARSVVLTLQHAVEQAHALVVERFQIHFGSEAGRFRRHWI